MLIDRAAKEELDARPGMIHDHINVLRELGVVAALTNRLLEVLAWRSLAW